jgi:hypothetical protein
LLRQLSIASVQQSGGGQKRPFKILAFVNSVAVLVGATDETSSSNILAIAGAMMLPLLVGEDLMMTFREGKSGVAVK